METSISHLGGYTTVSRIVADLPRFGLKLERSTILRWCRRQNVPIVKFGQTMCLPSWALTELLRDYEGGPKSPRQGTGR